MLPHDKFFSSLITRLQLFKHTCHGAPAGSSVQIQWKFSSSKEMRPRPQPAGEEATLKGFLGVIYPHHIRGRRRLGSVSPTLSIFIDTANPRSLLWVKTEQNGRKGRGQPRVWFLTHAPRLKPRETRLFSPWKPALCQFLESCDSRLESTVRKLVPQGEHCLLLACSN